ncbi:MAG: cysteine synthase A [Synergistaceae bacterium]|nr:cysteine synthase A [Synergistaceae bacterium]
MKKLNELSIIKLIGNTPLYKLNLITGGAPIYIKLEGNNPGGSIKDRAAFGMLKRAEDLGLLNGNTVIVEPTSGNTGIGLALLGSALGLKVILTMPESMSLERRKVLAAFGAELILTPADKGMAGAVEAANGILKENPNAIMLDQFSNEGNPQIHETTTAVEILDQIGNPDKIGAFVASFGTGGTVSGMGRTIKKENKASKIVAVEPASSPLITEGKAGAHKIQGIGPNFIPKCLDKGVIDEFITVTDDEAIEMTKYLSRKEGIFSGISTGANVVAAMKIAKNISPDKVVVTIQPDRGDKYLSVF